ASVYRLRRATGRRGVRLLALAAVVGLSVVATATAANAVLPVPAPATLVSTNPADHTPHARNGEVRAFAEIGDLVYVGGTFTEVRAASASTWQAMPYLFAYHRDTGALATAF